MYVYFIFLYLIQYIGDINLLIFSFIIYYNLLWYKQFKWYYFYYVNNTKKKKKM